RDVGQRHRQPLGELLLCQPTKFSKFTNPVAELHLFACALVASKPPLLYGSGTKWSRIVTARTAGHEWRAQQQKHDSQRSDRRYRFATAWRPCVPSSHTTHEGNRDACTSSRSSIWTTVDTRKPSRCSGKSKRRRRCWDRPLCRASMPTIPTTQ